MRFGLLAMILGCCCYGLAADWPEVYPPLTRMRWYSLVGSAAAAMAGAGCMMMAWRALLADLGSRLTVAVTARVTFVSQLAKYVPGAVWSFAAHVELGHEYQVPRRRGAASVIVALAVTVAVGLMIAAIALPLAAPTAARRYLFVLAAVPVLGVCLLPPVLQRLLDRALIIFRQPRLEKQLGWCGLGAAVAWTTLGWLFLGLQAWLLTANVAATGPRTPWLALGAYAFACSAALLLVVFPNGIGARELLFVAAVAPVIPSGPALAVALVARLVTTVSDLAWGGIGLTIGRVSRSAARQPGRSLAPGHVGKHRKTAAARLRTAEPEGPGIEDRGLARGLR